jgi:beta-glucosidase
MPTSASTDTPLYLDPSQDLDARADDLVGRMTLEEKCGQMLHSAKAIERLGVPAYNWWSECLHGVGRAGRATVFPQAIGMAATWDEPLIRRVADAIADEARAKHHAAVKRGNRGQYRGLTFWSPNVNLFRDPRWGRGHETWGEDPVLTATLGAAFVRGLQGDDPRYMKAAACAKHYAVHSGPEALRHEFDAVVSPKDLHETYLPAFKALVDAGVESFMGAYNRTNGEPCCGSETLLVNILRGQWNFRGHVVSDCWAIKDFHENHKITNTASESAALAVKNGCDLNCGEVYGGLLDAVSQGLLDEEDISLCVKRLMRTRIKLGMFDPEAQVPYASIGMDVVNCEKHQQLALETATKSLVLLKNAAHEGKPVLPIDRDKPQKIMVYGPNAADVDVLLGNYYGLSGNMTSVLEGIAQVQGEVVNVEYRKACELLEPNRNPRDWAQFEARSADLCIFVGGGHPMLEGEEGEAILSDAIGDRDDINLPQVQIDFIKKIAQHQTPVVLVLAGGSATAFEEVFDLCEAVLWMWYPGEAGGRAVADVLFGEANPSGKLPVTFPKSLDQLPAYEDYAIATGGRTYRYMSDEPFLPFGFGLSFTQFTFGGLTLSAETIKPGDRLDATVTVTNVGDVAGEEVVQLYLTDDQASAATPRYALKAFTRVALAPGESKPVTLALTPAMMELVTDTGTRLIEPGTFTVSIGGSSPDPRNTALGAAAPAQARFTVS